MTTILIVDDHKHLVESMATTIPWESLAVRNVRCAYSGQEALQAIEREAIDIVITDIRMPVMSGLEMIAEARLRSPHPIDFVVLTGYSEFEYAKRALELAAAEYLVKPVRDEELIAAVSRLIARRAARMREQEEAEALKQLVSDRLPQLQAELLSARADAEHAVLEERSRIAHDIHDIVGYTLMSTLVQIEAAKLQLTRSEAGAGPAGLKLLEQSQELVRQGLSEVRQVVGLIQRAEGEADLRDVLVRFIETAETTMNVAVEYDIEMPGPSYHAPLRKAMLHALQEGITNGVRHGRAARFQLRLAAEDAGELAFTLWNDGLPYNGSAKGVGLSAMQERIQALGGSCSLEAAREPQGTILTIRLPMPDAAAAAAE
jgi:signal transduction histidine kinase